jgi:hypothetical protein
MRHMLAGTAVAIAMLLGGAQDASAQTYAQQVWTQLQRVYSVANANDYTLRNYILGHLDQGATDSWTFPLRANTEYIVTGACDNDCSDLDIFIKNAGGTEVARDETADDIPVVRFRTGAAGRYTVDVKMYACSSAPCYFGFGVFQR